MSRYSYRRRTVKIKSSLIDRAADPANPLSGQGLAGVNSTLRAKACETWLETQGKKLSNS